MSVVAALVGGNCLGDTRADALGAAKKAVAFYTRKVATEGGYLWRYSADLSLREGEGKVTGNTVWVQPPGTPAMGEAFVKLYDATGEAAFLDAARGVAEALRRGQLRSGGWQDHIDFDSADRVRIPYRIDPPGKKTKQVFSSLDDDKVIDALDERGAWVTADKLRYHRYEGPIIDMAVAVKNLTILAEYLRANSPVSFRHGPGRGRGIRPEL